MYTSSSAPLIDRTRSILSKSRTDGILCRTTKPSEVVVVVCGMSMLEGPKDNKVDSYKMASSMNRYCESYFLLVILNSIIPANPINMANHLWHH